MENEQVVVELGAAALRLYRDCAPEDPPPGLLDERFQAAVTVHRAMMHQAYPGFSLERVKFVARLARLHRWQSEVAYRLKSPAIDPAAPEGQMPKDRTTLIRRLGLMLLHAAKELHPAEDLGWFCGPRAQEMLFESAPEVSISTASKEATGKDFMFMGIAGLVQICMPTGMPALYWWNRISHCWMLVGEVDFGDSPPQTRDVRG